MKSKTRCQPLKLSDQCGWLGSGVWVDTPNNGSHCDNHQNDNETTRRQQQQQQQQPSRTTNNNSIHREQPTKLDLKVAQANNH